MRRWGSTLLLAGVVAACVASADAEDKKPAALNFTMKSIAGKDVDLSQYQGKVLLVVNVASQCGLTKQYEPLEAVYEKYQDKGLVVLGFPCNQFGQQEPGSEAEIAEFCQANYQVKFPMFAKIDVNGEKAAPLYKALKDADDVQGNRGRIQWNFEKFVLTPSGEVHRFRPNVKPDDEAVVSVIEANLPR